MLGKSKQKLISSLRQKKFRQKEGLFIAEGQKLIQDLLKGFTCKELYYTTEYTGEIVADKSTLIEWYELKKISNLERPQDALAIFEMLPQGGLPELSSEELYLALDNVQDVGNLGTIIRIADWFGIEHIFCSIGTADAFNPKTVQASMGALARVRMHYVDLISFLKKHKEVLPVYATSLDGADVYKEELSSGGLMVMGNEGNGVSKEVLSECNKFLYIPNFPDGRETSESLNVGVATAVVCAEFRRRLR